MDSVEKTNLFSVFNVFPICEKQIERVKNRYMYPQIRVCWTENKYTKKIYDKLYIVY